jgi:hypothetical protein
MMVIFIHFIQYKVTWDSLRIVNHEMVIVEEKCYIYISIDYWKPLTIRYTLTQQDAVHQIPMT